MIDLIRRHLIERLHGDYDQKTLDKILSILQERITSASVNMNHMNMASLDGSFYSIPTYGTAEVSMMFPVPVPANDGVPKTAPAAPSQIEKIPITRWSTIDLGSTLEE